MDKMIKFLERSKKYTTETEENSSEATIRLNKDGTPSTKSRFNARRILAKIAFERKQNQHMFLVKLSTWSLAVLPIFCGHFYCAIFILWSASILHKEVISMGHIL